MLLEVLKQNDDADDADEDNDSEQLSGLDAHSYTRKPSLYQVHQNSRTGFTSPDSIDALSQRAPEVYRAASHIARETP